MALMIDTKPSYKGEGKVWETLKEFLPDEMVVYNQREVNGREYDFCLLIENLGIVVIEVKGWLYDKITVNGVDNIMVEGYDKPQTSPKKQARAYRFAILNKIIKKYNKSPLVLDLVCYPFISEKEYKECHLDIISETEYTIFSEDLENKENLNNKIQNIFQINNVIPHADFSKELFLCIRRSLEPGFEETKADAIIRPYSVLSVYKEQIGKNEINLITENYLAGVKIVAFVGASESYKEIINSVISELNNHNITINGNNLSLGNQNAINYGQDCFRIFNFEIYLVNDLDAIVMQNLTIKEGNIPIDCYAEIKELSNRTVFNLQQYEIEHATVERDILVEAGAGTGKTFSMVSRVAFLCNKEKNPVTNIAEEIAMVTFTNDAAINMKKRLKQMFVNYFILTGKEKYLRFIEDVDRANISTIHSFAIGIMREESLYTGLGTNFRISENEYKRGKAYDVYLSAFLEEMENENHNFVNEIPVPVYDLKKKLISIADRLFDKSISFDKIKISEMGVPSENNIPYFNDLLYKVVFPAEALYLESLKTSNDLDLKQSLIELGRMFSSGCEKIEELKLRYLFIDEFQDTDDVQIELFQMLQKRINANCKLFVVGDLKQSIYRFRGAKLNAFQKLQKGNSNEWSHHRLNRNYRTDGRLLDLYAEIFAQMGKKQILPYSSEDDQLISDVMAGEEDDKLLIEVPCHGKENGQIEETLSQVIVSEIDRIKELMKTRHLSKEDRTIAVLVRSNWQVDNVVKSAAEENIEIEISSGGDLFQLPSTLDLYKLVLAVSNSTNPVYLVNFIESNYIKIKLDYQRLQCLSEEEKLEELRNILNTYCYEKMGLSWNSIINESFTQPILYVLKKVIDSLKPWENYARSSDRKRLYIANLEYLIEKITKFTRIESLTLSQVGEYLGINILTGQQQLSRTGDLDDEGVHVICTTVHKSKGLEYGTVVLPYTFEDIGDIKKVRLEANYNDNNLSYTVMFENGIREKNTNYSEDKEIDEQIAEESRILYVAMTRAIRKFIWINNVDASPRISWGSLLEG